MRKLVAALGMSVALLGSGAALAAPYGDAGCGLGSVIFKDEKGLVQVLAATTNGFFGTQTFGITTGTLNCGESALKVSSTTKVFIEANREAVAKDVARGSGETIVSLSNIAGCADAGQVGTTLQAHFSGIFPSPSATSDEVTNALLATLKADPALACSRI